MTYFPLRQTTCFFIPLVAPCKPLLTVDDYQAEKDKIMFYRDALLKELKKRDKSNNISN